MRERVSSQRDRRLDVHVVVFVHELPGPDDRDADEVAVLVVAERVALGDSSKSTARAGPPTLR